MESRNQEILSGLKTAMEAELTGHEFYKNAARGIADPQAREALKEMAEEEMTHFNYLRHQYKSILEKGNYDFSKKLSTKKKGGRSPIFSEAIRARIKESHYEVSVLTIGMKLELEAIQYYRACAQKAEAEEARQFYLELTQWEEGHYQAFERELESLKEEYWHANNFIPM